jgi:hypothetical protein
MSTRYLVLSLVLSGFACGGHASIDASAGGARGTAIMGGTGGSLGTAGSVSTGGNVAFGGAATAGATSSSGAGGFDWGACAPSDTCVLETPPCGAGCEPIPLSRYTPVNGKYDVAYRAQEPQLACVSGGCPAVAPGSQNAPNYYAACQAGRCRVLDVRTSSLSVCTTDSQCYLRSGTSCCCGNDGPIAVSSSANPEAAFCGANGGCAADCVGAPLPTGVAAVCSLSGHCFVRYPDQKGDAGPAQ